MEVGIHIDEHFQDLTEEWFRQVLMIALTSESPGSQFELGLVVADDEAVQELNRRYRGVDETTDVLAFALAEQGDANATPTFVNPPDGMVHLGDIVISYPQAVRQAEENRQPLQRELALLVIHGALHLLGYDHSEPAEDCRMRAVESKLLAEVESRLASRSSEGSP